MTDNTEAEGASGAWIKSPETRLSNLRDAYRRGVVFFVGQTDPIDIIKES